VDFQIKKADETDVSYVVELIREFAEFEKLSDYCEVTEADLRESVFGQKAFVHALVAFDNGDCVGYALFFPVFKSFRGEGSMFLEDLYVSPKGRGKGFGLALLKAVAKTAKEQGFARMDWQALKWNEPAINFYVNLGATHHDENFDFQLRGEAFRNLAA
jgi:GNAT superfamily N-acetyltransferase